MPAYIKYRVECRLNEGWAFYARTDVYSRAVAYFKQAKAASTKPAVQLIEVDSTGTESVVISHVPARLRNA